MPISTSAAVFLVVFVNLLALALASLGFFVAFDRRRRADRRQNHCELVKAVESAHKINMELLGRLEVLDKQQAELRAAIERLEHPEPENDPKTVSPRLTLTDFRKAAEARVLAEIAESKTQPVFRG